jgi:hypothetical protein
MKTKSLQAKRPIAGFTGRDLLTLVVIGGVLLCILVVELGRAQRRSKTICCNCNLKQVGLAFRTWALDHHELFPMGVSTNDGGSREFITTGETFRHFQVMSNELSTPVVLACPVDSRWSAEHFDRGFGNSNLSYFAGVVTNDENPQLFLSGDRNITGGVWLANQILQLTTNEVIGWSAGIHRGAGNLGLADGSVDQSSTFRLQERLSWTGQATNRLAMPGP